MILIHQSKEKPSNAFNAPRVARPTNTNLINNVADRTYAIIISGGAYPSANYSRYWNDCSFIYQTLRKRYDIPKENIELFMADGDNPGLDMLDLKDFTYKSSPLDLDFDGVDDLKYSATKANIKSKLESLSAELQEDDHLFIYVIDHGGTTNPGAGTSYINLWGSERLFDYELADMVKPLTDNLVSVNAVLGQCYSGGFIKELTKVSCVCATACSATESSYACPNISYDEFVYHWTCAVNGADHLGNPVNADTHRTNFVSMKEAFDYALANDRQNEHPQYISTPVSVGDDLAFNNLAKAIDLYIKDGYDDTGIEPNWTTQEKWKSPSIWVRNVNDSIEEHENPIISPEKLGAALCMRIDNRGKKSYTRGQFVHCYWALASMGINEATWKSAELLNDEIPTGGYIGTASIGAIPAGESRLVTRSWGLPDELFSRGLVKDPHFCLWCIISDKPYPPVYDPKEAEFDVAYNDQAQKNVTMIDAGDWDKGISVIVRNITGDITEYSLELIPETPKDAELFKLANVSITMSSSIFKAWDRNGAKCKKITRKSNDPYTVQFDEIDGSIDGIKLSPNQFDQVSIAFPQKIVTSPTRRESSYTIDVVQRNADGEIVGGETFVLKTPTGFTPGLPLITTNLENGQYKISTGQEEDSNSFTWENQQGEKIGDKSEVIVTPTPTNQEFSVMMVSKEGEAIVGNISLEPTIGIKSVSTTSGNNVDVEFYSPIATNNSIVTVTNLTTNANVLTANVPEGHQHIEIDATTIPTGLYSVTLMVDGENIDSQKFVK